MTFCFLPQIHCSEYNYSRLVVTGRLPEVGFLGRTPASEVHGVLMVPEGDASDGRPYIVHNDPRPLKIPFAIAPGLKVRSIRQFSSLLNIK